MVWQWLGQPPEPEFQCQKSRLFLIGDAFFPKALSIVNTVFSGGASVLSFPVHVILYFLAPLSVSKGFISSLSFLLPLMTSVFLYSFLINDFFIGYFPLSLITADHTLVSSPDAFLCCTRVIFFGSSFSVLLIAEAILLCDFIASAINLYISYAPCPLRKFE